jgi:hypothetical protein
MNKPRIFLGSSGKQAELLQAITRGLEDVADVEPWPETRGRLAAAVDGSARQRRRPKHLAIETSSAPWTCDHATDASGGIAP